MSRVEHDVELDPVFGCWLWQGKVDTRDGYGVVLRRGQAPRSAHRYVWTKERGEIAETLVLDHLCRVRLCCAPHHLEAVDQQENERRKSWRYRAKRTHCAKGHALALSGIVTSEGGRVCRDCNREDQA